MAHSSSQKVIDTSGTHRNPTTQEDDKEDGELDPNQVNALFFKLGFSETEKFNWRQLAEHTDINQVIAGSIDQLEALQPGLARADLQKDLQFACPRDPNALKMIQTMQLGI